MSAIVNGLARKPFHLVWESIADVEGWLLRSEAELLYRTAADFVSEGGFILEIGAYHGKSTRLLASLGHEMVTIDPLLDGAQINASHAIDSSAVSSLTDAVNSHDNLNWIRLESRQVSPEVLPPIDCLYIDGCHDGNSAYDDFNHFAPRLKDNALIAFHDVDTNVDVTQCVKRLEREGRLSFLAIRDSMYIGIACKQQASTPDVTRVFLAVPHCHDIESETNQSVKNCVFGHSGIHVDIRARPFSILTSNFNKLVVGCLNADHYDYFALNHSDIETPPGSLGMAVRMMQKHNIDVLHAVSPIKCDTGETSTAVAYSSDRWSLIRKLTQYEIHELPELFDVNDCRRVIDPKIERLLCNTGYLVIRIGDWFKDFPGFSNLDRIERVGEKKWVERVVPEDWNFGHWCADRGINVWGTRSIVVGHWGRHKYSSDRIWGHKIDPRWAAMNGVPAN